MSISPGLCSITFRSLTTDEVLQAALRAGVEGIEWGADGHVPPGGGPTVEALGAPVSRDAGIEIVSYGSYLGFAPADGDGRDRHDRGRARLRRGARRADGPDLDRARRERRVTRRRPPTRHRAHRRGSPTRSSPGAGSSPRSSSTRTPSPRPPPRPTSCSPPSIDRTSGRTGSPTRRGLPPTAVTELAAVTPHLAHVHTFTWGPRRHRRSPRARRRCRPLAPAFALADHAARRCPGVATRSASTCATTTPSSSPPTSACSAVGSTRCRIARQHRRDHTSRAPAATALRDRGHRPRRLFQHGSLGERGAQVERSGDRACAGTSDRLAAPGSELRQFARRGGQPDHRRERRSPSDRVRDRPARHRVVVDRAARRRSHGLAPRGFGRGRRR